jgi:hypothetical protein
MILPNGDSREFTMREQYENVGFRRPDGRSRPLTRRNAAFAQLIATVTLMLSIAVAATAVSIGIARADTIIGTNTYEGPIAAIIVAGGALAVMGIVVAGAGRPDRGAKD